MPGHNFDSNTLALWRMDEASGTAVADFMGAYSLTATNGASVVVGNFGNARAFDGSLSQYLTGAGNAAAATGFTGGWTVEAWVKPVAASAGNKGIFRMVGSGAWGDATLYLDDQNRVCGRMLYDGSLTETQGATQLVAGTWYHVALRRSTAGTFHVCVNGAKDTISTHGAGPSGTLTAPSTVTFEIGRFSDSLYFSGSIDDLRVSGIARAFGEIADNATGAPKAHGHPLIVAPATPASIALWRLDEDSASSNAADATGTYPLTPAASAPTLGFGRWDHGRVFTTNQYLSVAADAALVSAAIADSWTLEAWIYPTTLSSWQGIFGIGPDSGYDELMALYTSNTALHFQAYNHGPNFSTDAGVLVLNKWQHVACRKRKVGTYYHYDLFVDGVMKKTASFTGNPPGTGSGYKAYIGHGHSLSYWWQGRIDDVAFYAGQRTDAEIADDAAGLVYAPIYSASHYPVIASYSRTDNTKITVEFNEDTNHTDLNDATKYSINNGITVSAAVRVAHSSKSTVLTVSPALSATTLYTLTATGIRTIDADEATGTPTDTAVIAGAKPQGSIDTFAGPALTYEKREGRGAVFYGSIREEKGNAKAGRRPGGGFNTGLN